MDGVSAPVLRPPVPTGARVMALVLAGSGVLHLVRPRVYRRLVPPVFPDPGLVVSVSGVAELVCAAGLLSRQRWAPWVSAGLLVGVWPGNWWMAVDAQRDPAIHPAVKAALWARLPVQLPMIRAVLSARTARPGPIGAP